MDLPADITVEIVEYLNLEYSISKQSELFKTDDLKYEGTRLINDKEIMYWKYPCSQSNCWVTVEPFEDSYLISITTVLPDI